MLKNIVREIRFYKISSIVGLLTFAPSALAQISKSAPVTLNNPLRITSLQELLVAILNILVILAIPVIVFFIIYSGFLYVTAKGNAAQIEQATRSLTYAIVGGVLIIGAVAIAEIVKNLVTSF